MALFNRFLTHVQRKKETPKELSLWKQHYDRVPENGRIMRVLFSFKTKHLKAMFGLSFSGSVIEKGKNFCLIQTLLNAMNSQEILKKIAWSCIQKLAKGLVSNT